jgi:beta-lactamase regulating signal transducer with metallopeptidase domain
MNIIQMSISAGILILMVVAVRRIAIHKLPKKTFMLLWGMVLIRLSVPFYIPVTSELPVNIFETIGGAVMPFTEASGFGEFEIIPDVIQHGGTDILLPTDSGIEKQFVTVITLWIVWSVGALGLALFFLVAHIRRRREYSASLPVEYAYAREWLKEQKIRRCIQIRQSDKVSAPLTYGIFKPIILFPKTIDWQDETKLKYVLTHEIIHIKRFDILTKWLLAAVLCVHWFNPLVWVMYILANRDIELSCDETVLKTFGEKTKSAYAMALVELEENRGAFAPMFTNFSKNALEERTIAIMKTKKISIVGIMLAFILILGSTAVIAATSTSARKQSGDGADNHDVMTYIPAEATEMQIWLVEYFGGLYRSAPTIEELSYVGYDLASRLVFSRTAEQFDEYFGNGAAYSIMAGEDFRTLFALLNYEMFYDIIAVENFRDWLVSIFGSEAMSELDRLPKEPAPYVITRRERFEHMLNRLVVDVRNIVVTPDMLLDLTLSHEETLPRGFMIIDGNIHDVYGNLLIALDENGLMACGTRISAEFSVGVAEVTPFF